MATPTRVIFLDIDGVLTSFACDDGLDPACLHRLDRLVRDTGASLVLISSWRDRYGLDATATRLADAGLETPLLEAVPLLLRQSRSAEIYAYLRARREPVTFVILDDVLADGSLRQRQVLVDAFVGLQPRDLDLARVLLR